MVCMHWNVCMTQEKLKRIQDIILLLNRQVRGKKLSNELTGKNDRHFLFFISSFFFIVSSKISAAVADRSEHNETVSSLSLSLELLYSAEMYSIRAFIFLCDFYTPRSNFSLQPAKHPINSYYLQ